MKILKKFFKLVLPLTVLLLAIAGCSTNKSNVKTAQINQIVKSGDSLQENGYYVFEDGNLDVSLSFSPFLNPNKSPSDTEYDAKINNEIKQINKEFPKAKLTKKEFDNKFVKSLKNVTFSIEKKDKKVLIKGNDINKEFQMSDSNDNRLIDDLGTEYELVYTK
ncbi:hypothetical protein [Vagococcus carniphilus]|uniref:DUF1307 domain-containing protein n=1 Tax=Vagococcus carniphilus TaxID=218144 RepID=A0A430B3I7_9ENTE|nr:hypothetical protein [Vagococcus carniphilus]QNN73382.1 hypothetical protein H9L18_01940 [Vagococcus carniphilus]RSU14874.1 hypothetical protein CBF28_07330 [Vagococcus carniphilus]